MGSTDMPMEEGGERRERNGREGRKSKTKGPIQNSKVLQKLQEREHCQHHCFFHEKPGSMAVLFSVWAQGHLSRSQALCPFL